MRVSEPPGPRSGSLSSVIDEVIRRVVEVASPDRIVLFGSAARGGMRPGSDIDLLVIKSGAHRLELTRTIYRRLIGVGLPVDVVVVTPEDVTRYRHANGLVIEPALDEGRVVYDATALPAR